MIWQGSGKRKVKDTILMPLEKGKVTQMMFDIDPSEEITIKIIGTTYAPAFVTIEALNYYPPEIYQWFMSYFFK